MIASRRALLTGLAALPAVVLPRLVLARDLDARFEAALDSAFADGPPALAGAVVSRDGASWSGVRGVRRTGHEAKATQEDRWHLGSNTKAMTAAVFGRLVEQGRARWDMTLTEALPDLTIDPAWAATTPEDLMRHRAGLLDAGLLDQAWLIGAHADQRPLPEQRAGFAAKALGSPPVGPVGQFAYANGNYIVLGAVLEALTGQAWEAVMESELYAPLGLGSAGFGAPRGEAPWGHRGGVPVDPAGFADNPRALGPAGTAHMSLADYARFVSAMMGGEPGWLGEDTRRRLLTPAAGSPPAYAAGWGVGTAPWAGVGGRGPTISHNGSNTMWFATVLAAPERGLGFIALANDAAAGQRACQGLVQRLAALHTQA